MEFTLKKEIPFICLNMIVKDEAHIIETTLKKLLNKINIEYWVISDTGSSDNTKEIITNFFKERNIPGELYDDEWQDFGYNRTKALIHAFKKSKYVLIFDADDEIFGDFMLPTIKDSNGQISLEKDAYHFNFGDINGIAYTRILLVNNQIRWEYIGVLHEFISCFGKSYTSDFITGNYYTISGKTGNRSKDQNKYLNDALVLKKAYGEALKKNDQIYNRYAFYCANSYFDSGKFEEAIIWYKITLKQNNWIQEKYMACLKLFYCYKNIQQEETGRDFLVQSFSYDTQRVECIYELVLYYCVNNMPQLAYNYYQLIKDFYENHYLETPMLDKLFLDVGKFNLFLPYYMILVADKCKEYNTVLKMFRIIFVKKHKGASKFYIGNMLFNLQFFI
jgi:tetratricopeptide (TPR) repeat protein